ncbi:MAG: MFS transporter [Acidobacteria bacterium]|nr:MFS transporter [Acidobacteriota bacterium]
MSFAAPGRARDLASTRWLVLTLLVISSFINYIDRGNLSVAAHSLSQELQIAPERLGLLLSGFFWTYAAFQMISGWLIDRYNVYLLYGMGFLLWSAATALTGLATSFWMIFGFRLLLGSGESVAYPAYSKIICAAFPEHRRGLANALIDVGTKAGPALGTLIGGLVIATYGWRALFLILGFGAMTWLLPWFLFAPRDDHEFHTSTRGGPSILQIAGQRSAWGTFLGLFCCNYVWYFLLTWLPYYLIRERHFSMERMAVVGALPYLAIAVTTLIAGATADRLIFSGRSATLVRKSCLITGLLGVNFLLPAAMAETPETCIKFMIVACLSFGLIPGNMWAVTQTLAGPTAAGKWTGMQNMMGNLAGVAAPWITGAIVASTGSFFFAFGAVCVASLIGATSYLFLIPAVKPITWPDSTLGSGRR